MQSDEDPRMEEVNAIELMEIQMENHITDAILNNPETEDMNILFMDCGLDAEGNLRMTVEFIREPE